MSLNSRIIKALEPMKLKVTVSEHLVNDEEGKPQQPDAFLVIIPGTDDFPVCADDRPIVETEEVELALYCKGNYLKMRDEITTRLLDADKLILTTKATKDITKRYGGLEKLGDKLLKNATMEESLGEVIWLIALLANQEILIHNLQHRDEPKPLLTEDEIELLTNPYELAEYKDAIMAAMLKGTKRHVESMPEKNEKGNAQTGQSHQK